MPYAAKMPASTSPMAMPTRVGCSVPVTLIRPGHALRDLVEPGSLRIRPGGAEAGDVAVDQARIARPATRRAEPELGHDGGAKVLDHHVGAVGQPQERRRGRAAAGDRASRCACCD